MPSWRVYCSREHKNLDRRGKPGPRPRTGAVVYCALCGTLIGYRGPRWLKRTKHGQHFCRKCLPEWRKTHPPPRADPPRGECGHVVSERGVRLCKRCYLKAQRGRVTRKWAAAEVEAVIADLEAKGRPFTKVDVASLAKVSRKTVYNALARRAISPPRPRQHVPSACGDARGTVAGYHRHYRATPREEPCGPCREAWRARRRQLHADKRAGKPAPGRRWRAGRQGPIDHGTEKGYRAHQRRKEEPCDECRRAHRDAGRDDGRKRRAEDPEGERARLREWRQKNPERVREQKRRARERRKRAGTSAERGA